MDSNSRRGQFCFPDLQQGRIVREDEKMADLGLDADRRPAHLRPGRALRHEGLVLAVWARPGGGGAPGRALRTDRPHGVARPAVRVLRHGGGGGVSGPSTCPTR